MPRFDIPGRKGPAKTILHPYGRERVFDLPYDTEDPDDLKLLRSHPLLVESKTPAPVAMRPPEGDHRPTKAPPKEVDEE